MKYKTVFLSDLHLGNPHLQHEKLLDFLKSLETEDGHDYAIDKLYLVGDIIDMTNINHKILWGTHRKIIKKFLRMADKLKTRGGVIYVLGNHDIYLTELLKIDHELNLNGITLTERHIHETVNGDKVLVYHGHQLDGKMMLHPWIYSLGDHLYGIILSFNKIQNRIRKLFGYDEWSFAHWIKSKTKQAVSFISKFEHLVVEDANKANCNIVIAGHIHIPQDRMIENIRYMNTGTFCEVCSCVVEYPDGTLESIILE